MKELFSNKKLWLDLTIQKQWFFTGSIHFFSFFSVPLLLFRLYFSAIKYAIPLFCKVCKTYSTESDFQTTIENGNKELIWFFCEKNTW